MALPRLALLVVMIVLFPLPGQASAGDSGASSDRNRILKYDRARSRRGDALRHQRRGNPPVDVLSSCVAPYPMDANKCHLYTCNEATGQYTATDKKCGDKQECDSTTGQCFNVCKTYSGTGTFVIKPCDVLKGDHFTLRVDKLSYDNYGKNGMVDFDARYDNNGKKLEESFNTMIGGAPKSLNTLAYNHLAIYGGFIRLAPSSKPVDIKHPEATLIVEPDCKPLLNECMADLAKNGPNKGSNMVLGYSCQLICPAAMGFPQQVYVATQDIRLETPPGYSKVAKAVAHLAQNCYDHLVDLFGIEASHPIFISYTVSTFAGCAAGLDEQYKLPCFVTPEYADGNIEKLPQYAPLLSAINAGQCSGFFDQLGQVVEEDGLPHEMSHNFAFATFMGGNSEGFATFSAYTISNSDLECYPTGYLNGTIYSYTPWTSENYFGGACLLKEYQKLYGDKIFKEAFQLFHQLSMEKDFYLFKDVLNAAAQDDFFAKSKGIHKLSADPALSVHLMQYFFNSP